MTARLLSGKPVAEEIKAEVAAEVAALRFRPGLAVVRVGEDPASAVYVGSKVKTTEELGMHSEHIHLPAETSGDEILAIVNELNSRDDIDGILVQLPLPGHINEREILEAIDPVKDVDGFHPMNVGRLSQGQDALVPCTPAGVIEILKRSEIEIAGKNAVVLGRSNIVGKPMAMLLLRENATVTICHSKTRDLALSHRKRYPCGRHRPRRLCSGRSYRRSATVIDVGINNVSDASWRPSFFR